MSQESQLVSPFTACSKEDAELALTFQTSCSFLSTTDFISFWAYFQYKSVTEPACYKIDHHNK